MKGIIDVVPLSGGGGGDDGMGCLIVLGVALLGVLGSCHAGYVWLTTGQTPQFLQQQASAQDPPPVTYTTENPLAAKSANSQGSAVAKERPTTELGLPHWGRRYPTNSCVYVWNDRRTCLNYYLTADGFIEKNEYWEQRRKSEEGWSAPVIPPHVESEAVDSSTTPDDAGRRASVSVTQPCRLPVAVLNSTGSVVLINGEAARPDEHMQFCARGNNADTVVAESGCSVHYAFFPPPDPHVVLTCR